jgi:pyruvate dehydrogenase E2 component (dihydrolipoamide acetyltransferase)
MQSGVLLEWYVDEGESVDEGDILAEIESEKTTAEVTSRESGVLRRTVLETGSEVAPGTPMGIVAPADADIGALLETIADEDEAPESSSAEPATDSGGTKPQPPTASTASASVRATPKARRRAAEEGIDLSSVRGTGPKGAVTVADISTRNADRAPARASTTTGVATGESRILATPRARKRASESNTPLETVQGTGPDNAIRVADVEAADEVSSKTGASPAIEDTTGDRSTTAGRTVVREQPLTGMRSTIARRLSESWEAPHVTIDRRIDAESLLEAADMADDVVSITDILLKAVSETLNAHPEFNATYEEGVHRMYREHNVGFAVDVESGLITPVLKEIESKSVTEIACERRSLSDRVQSRRQNPADLQGGTFTISNLGMFNVDSFTPIINPPQVAILGINAIKEEPHHSERGIVFRKSIGFSLSFDHCIVDGADAARFLNTLETKIETADELLRTES